jgi:glycosyltransferase involved in cell wall biosynthesis
MKVLVVNTMVPFVRGDAEAVADDLIDHLRRTPGVSAELLRIPFSGGHCGRILEQMLLCRMMELYWVDRVIGLRFPAYLIPHEHKTVWLLHQSAEAYDLPEAGTSHIPPTPEAGAIREMVKRAGDQCFAAARSVFAGGVAAQDWLHRHNGIAAPVLQPPLGDPELFSNRATGDYIFVGGPVSADGRQKLLIEALKRCRSGVHLIIGGVAETEADAAALWAAAADPALHGRLTLDLGQRDRSKLAAYINGALACAYLPIGENAGCYNVTEALQAEKAVITARDVPGTRDFVVDQETGFVTDARPECLADVMDCLFHDRHRAEELGRAGHALWRERNVSWPTTIERLLS